VSRATRDQPQHFGNDRCVGGNPVTVPSSFVLPLVAATQPRSGTLWKQKGPLGGAGLV